MWLNKNYANKFISTFSEYIILPTFLSKRSYSATNFSKTIWNTVYPEFSTKQKCVLMLLNNRAYPEWISVECDINQTVDIVCTRNSTASPSKEKIKDARCPPEIILKGKFCYSLMFFKGKTSNDGSLMIPNTFFKLKSLKILNFLLIAIDVKLKSFLSVNYINHAFLKQFSYEKYFSTITYAVENISVRDSEGYFVKRTKYNMKNPQLFFDNVFSCHSGLFISSNKVCDGIMNCGIRDNSDEDGCKCKTANGKCKYIVNIAERRQWECSSLYFTGADGKCYSFDHEYNHTKEVNIISRKFVCKNGNEIDVLYVDDLVSDCGESADDEIILQDIIVNNTYYPCDTEGEIPCKNGHNRCFDFSHICVYRLNKYHHLVPCRTGGHLQECHNFECNLKYKCPNSYCIPLGYVCDGKWDCPSGFDENISHNCKIRTCFGFFHCSSSSICLPIEDICDNYFDCPLKDDELMCALQTTKCPTLCHCHKFAMLCLGYLPEISNIYHALPHYAIKVSFTSIISLHLVKLFGHLVKVDLCCNTIALPCNILSGNETILWLDISKNEISVLLPYCFYYLSRLELIYINHNHLHTIHKLAFLILPNLKVVNISYNSLNHIPPKFLYKLFNLKIMSILENSLFLLKSMSFENTKMDILESGDYRICCIASSAKFCTAIKPWYFNCKTLLPTFTMRICIVIVACLILIFNSLSVLLQSKVRTKYNIFPVVIMCLNISDMLVSVYFI